MLKRCCSLLCLLLLASEIFMDVTKGFLDKFQQNDYKVIPEWIEVVHYNKGYIKQLDFIAFKYNRTCTAFNATVLLNIDIGNDLEAIIEGSKFVSNEYRSFPAINFRVNFCDALAKNIAGAQSVYKCGNFTGCPLLIKNRRMHACNWTPDESRFPPLIPTGRYMIEGKGMYHSTEIFVARVYLSDELHLYTL